MSASAVDVRIQFQLLFWYGVITVAMLLTGMLLAANLFAIAFLLAAFGWLITLPYHAGIALVLSTIMFRAAFIVPFVPGRPYLWEIGAMLAWTGVPLTILLRKYPSDTATVIRENRWILLGCLLYSAVLVVTMMARGVGLNILGSEQGGGRFYMQQILSAILPLLFVLIPLKEKMFIRLLILQLALTGTFIVSELAFSVFPGTLRNLLYFFEISTDAAFFELQSMSFGIRRYQSLGWFFTSMVYLLCVVYRPRDFVSLRGLWLTPLLVGLYGISLMSGSRTVASLTPIVVLLLFWSQRFFGGSKVFFGALLTAGLLVLMYGQADRFPMSVQRAICVLPGINVSSQAAHDAQGTWALRTTLRRIGISMIPDYFWIGRGFTVYMDPVERQRFDAVLEGHLRNGRFYNGAVGLMVNTGVFGFAAMLLLFYGGTRVSWRIVRHVREHGAEDMAMRGMLFVAVFFVVQAVFFLLLHGDSEWAMRRFALQVGLLIAADRLLKERIADLAAARQLARETESA